MEKIRILLVDDSQRFRESALRFINTHINYSVLSWATSGEEAIKKIHQFNPDLILMDISMPGMGGLEATKVIKEIQSKTKVFILTISSGSEYNEEAFSAGADYFITKSDFATKLIPAI